MVAPFKRKQKVIFERGQRIRFTKSAKYDNDFKKGDFGVIERVVSPFPSATDTIYLVLPEKSGELMWVTGDDVEIFNQITIEEEEFGKQKVMCDSHYYEDMVPCTKPYGHKGLHEALGGLTWLLPSPSGKVHPYDLNDDVLNYKGNFYA